MGYALIKNPILYFITSQKTLTIQLENMKVTHTVLFYKHVQSCQSTYNTLITLNTCDFSYKFFFGLNFPLERTTYKIKIMKNCKYIVVIFL